MVLGRKGTGDTDEAEPVAVQRTAERFEKRRSDIIAAAIPVLNGLGFKGMRLTEVAELIGLKATGVTYYFPRKEELAVACVDTGLAIFHDFLAEAEREKTARARVARLIELHVTRDAAVRRGEATPLVSFGPIRSLVGEHFRQVNEGYRTMFRRARALLEAPELSFLDKTARSARTLILLEQLYWANAWLGDYHTEDFPRVAARMTDVICDGLAPPGAGFEPKRMRLGGGRDGAEAAKENFLLAATREINAHGYRGASVDRISASLNLTKGAFYHYNQAKDDLVAACFRRSFGIIREAQLRAREIAPDAWGRLVSAVTALVRVQLSGEGPLMRHSVLSSMPHEHQIEIVDHTYRAARTFAAEISDAIAEGGSRAVDPLVAAHLLGAAINVASDFHTLSAPPDACGVENYARPLLFGLLNP